MPRLSEMPQGASVTCLYYGGSGVGKTNFCGTAGSRALGINIGGGLATIQNPNFRKRHPNVNPIIETIFEESIPVKATAFDAVGDVLDSYMNDPVKLDEVDTFWVDDITALRRFAMNKGLEVNQQLNKSKSLAAAQKHDFLVVAVQDYQAEMSLMEQFVIHYVSRCKELNKHLIMTAHQRVTYNPPTAIGGEQTVNNIKPGFTGKTFPDYITGNFDLVWHAEKLGGGEGIKYRARTVGDNSLTAHTKIGLFPTLLENPNFLDVVKKIREG